MGWLKRVGPYVLLWAAGESFVFWHRPFLRAREYECLLVLAGVLWVWHVNNRPLTHKAVFDKVARCYRLAIGFDKDLCFADHCDEADLPRASKELGIGRVHCLSKADEPGGGLWVWLEDRR